MSETDFGIHIPTESQRVWSTLILVTVTDAVSGEPLSGAKVHLSIEGDGTFKLALHETQEDVVTDDNGQAFCIWYEYPIYNPRRDLNSTIHASCTVANAEITLRTFITVVGP